MRNIIRHAIGLLVFSFLCKIAVQAGNEIGRAHV